MLLHQKMSIHGIFVLGPVISPDLLNSWRKGSSGFSGQQPPSCACISWATAAITTRVHWLYQLACSLADSWTPSPSDDKKTLADIFREECQHHSPNTLLDKGYCWLVHKMTRRRHASLATCSRTLHALFRWRCWVSYEWPYSQSILLSNFLVLWDGLLRIWRGWRGPVILRPVSM